jgi:hypothetical protein
MQVGGVGAGFGTSRLWHDPNFEIARDYRPIPVQKGLGPDLELPKEEHVLPPEKKLDPYVAQEKAYDVAHEQMTRGVEGKKLLHGTTNPAAFDAAVTAARERTAQTDVTRTMVASRAEDLNRTAVHQAQLPVEGGMPTGNVRPQQVTPMAPGQVLQPQGSQGSSSDKEAKKAAQQVGDSSDASRLADAVALNLGGVVSAVGAAQIAAVSTVAAPAAMATGAASAAATTAAGAAQLSRGDDDDLDPLNRKNRGE